MRPALDPTSQVPAAPKSLQAAMPAQVLAMPVGRRAFTWRQSPDGTYALHCYDRRGAVLYVVPDAAYSGILRIRHPDGSFVGSREPTSGQGHAAMSVALGILNGSCQAAA